MRNVQRTTRPKTKSTARGGEEKSLLVFVQKAVFFVGPPTRVHPLTTREKIGPPTRFLSARSVMVRNCWLSLQGLSRWALVVRVAEWLQKHNLLVVERLV
jgi:hypothetical protein